MPDEIDDMLRGDDDDDIAAKQRILMLMTPALSSLELSIMEMRLAENAPDGLLPITVEFTDRDADGEALPDPPEMREIRRGASDFWLSHLSLVRSLGERADYASYAALCRQESMKPLTLKWSN